MKIKFIDLFCGMGGFRIAFEKNGCECVFSSEIDEHAINTYQNNFGEIPSGDITKIPTAQIPDHDILCAGFPCQAFSIAGKRLGFNDTRGTLFFEVARILKDKKPKAFILENVKGLTNHDNGHTLKVILNTIEELGYNYKYAILNAKDYGIPQNRERWYCVGFLKEYGEMINQFEFPKPFPLINDLTSIITTNNDKEYKISMACERNLLQHIQMKKIIVDEYTLAYEIRPSKCQFRNDKISPCLTAKMGTGGSNVPVVVNQKRKLTERECLAIMGYPEEYIIGKGYQVYKQIGNSVVVPVITMLANEITKMIEKKSISQ